MDGGERRFGVYVWIGAGLLFAAGGLWLLYSAFQIAGRSEADTAALEALCLQRLATLGTAARSGDHLHQGLAAGRLFQVLDDLWFGTAVADHRERIAGSTASGVVVNRDGHGRVLMSRNWCATQCCRASN